MGLSKAPGSPIVNYRKLPEKSVVYFEGIAGLSHDEFTPANPLKGSPLNKGEPPDLAHLIHADKMGPQMQRDFIDMRDPQSASFLITCSGSRR